MTPQYRIDSVALQNTPVIAAGVKDPQLLGNLADLNAARARPTSRTTTSRRRTTCRRTCRGRIGSVSNGIEKIVDDLRDRKNADGSDYLPAGTIINLRGQVESMNSAFRAGAGPRRSPPCSFTC